MMITYNSTVVVVPKESVLLIRTEWDEEADDWALVLAVNGVTMDTILSAEDYRDLAIEGEEDDWVLALFHQIVKKTAKALVSENTLLDLNTIIEEEVEFWTLVQDAL